MYTQQPNGAQTSLMKSAGPSSNINNGSGVVNLSRGKLYDIFTVPPVFTFTTSSNAAGSSATVTQYIFNVLTMNAAVTNNGSGAASITNTYGDGFSGKIYDSMIASANGGRGVLIKGFTIQSTNFTSGAQNATPFNTLQMQVLNANGQGGSTPIPIDVTAAQRNTQFQVGTLTVGFEFTLNTMNQISLSLPANTIFAITFTTENGSL